MSQLFVVEVRMPAVFPPHFRRLKRRVQKKWLARIRRLERKVYRQRRDDRFHWLEYVLDWRMDERIAAERARIEELQASIAALDADVGKILERAYCPCGHSRAEHGDVLSSSCAQCNCPAFGSPAGTTGL